MSISNLTNTKWVLNSSLNSDFGVFTYNINFISNNTNYTTFEINGTQAVILKYGSTNVYTELNGWSNQLYRIIEITGGTDVTNATLIAWLEANATQVEVTDLTNTKWELNENIPYTPYNAFNYSINHKCYTTTEGVVFEGSTFYAEHITNQRPNVDFNCIRSDAFYDPYYFSNFFLSDVLYTQNILASEQYMINTADNPANNVYFFNRVIEITGGTDATNPDLIVWLTENATLQPITPTKTFDLSTLQLSAGTHTIQVKARATGYRDSEFSNSVSYTVTPPQWSCVVAGLGSENPSSVTFTHTGTMPTFEEVTVNSNVFIKIPKMYRKVLATSDNQITSFEIANYKKDNSFVPYTCFVKEDGTTEMDYVLIGKYFTNSNNVMNSVDTNTVTQSINNGRTNARALGSGYQLYDWQMHKLWQDLIICKKQTINTNSGSGIGTNNYDDFGIYWGTSASWIDGVMGIYDSGYWMFSYKPSEYESDSIPNTYIQASYSQPTTGYTEIKKLGYDSSNPFFNYPSDIVFNSNYDTYYCDYYFKGSSKTVFCYVGHLSAAAGAFYCYITSGSVNNQGARLCYRPI